MKRILRENGLSIVLFGLFFFAFMGGQTFTGHREHNHEREDHGEPPISLPKYLRSSHFLEATMENWESEFLQMGAYVYLTVFLFQKGSSESKKLDEAEPVDRDPRESKHKTDAPWPVRRGGWVLKLYENSLSLAFALLFLIALWLHAVGGTGEYNEDQARKGEPTSAPSDTSRPAGSGSSRCRTGRASFWQSVQWSCSAFS